MDLRAKRVLQPGTVIIADDDEDFVLLLRAAFQSADIANPIQWISDGQELIDCLTGQGADADHPEHPPPLLLLLDVRLPRVSGFEILRWLRHRPEFHGLHVVVLTGVEIAGDAQRALQMGAEAYLVKPCNFDNLVELVEGLRRQLIPEPHFMDT
jgi:CheY-like chemotaxis protein